MQEQTAQEPFEAGRTESVPHLEARLPTASVDYVRGALENPQLDERLVVILLTNPDLPADLTETIVGDDRFRRSDDVKRALVLHPSTPANLSMGLVKFVPWRDLLVLMEDRRMASALRSAAEQTIGDRLNQLPAMEQTRLARTASRGIVPSFLKIRNPRVMQELLLNPRVVERDLVALGRDPNTPPEILGSLARNNQWASRPAVRSALMTNFSTPVQDAVRLVPCLGIPELRELSRNLKVRAPIRAEADKQLRNRQRR